MDFRTAQKSLLLGISIPGLIAATPGHAQGYSEDSVAADIVVTARRVEERLQDVPISITVYNQEQIDKRNIAVASDLGTYTPSLSVDQRYGPEKSSFGIRGFTQDIATAPTVGVYFADVVGVRAQGGTISGNSVGAGAFTDLQNVQVLKGPQGTLFGRNTTGGAVLLVPQKPTDQLEGYLEGSAGNYNMLRAQGALNLPLADNFKVRLSVNRMVRDGYMKNRSGEGSKAFNDVDFLYARLGILGDLTPDLENYTIFHYSKSNTNGFAARMAACDRNPIDFADPTGLKNPADPRFNYFRVVYASAGCDQLDRQAARGDKLTDVDVHGPDTFVKIEQWQAINTTTWRASDNLTVKNIASYGQYREHASYILLSENFFVPTLPFPLPQLPSLGQPLGLFTLGLAPGLPSAAESTFTEELQLQGQAADSRFAYVIGGYLEFSRPLQWNAGNTGIFAHCPDPKNLICGAQLGFAILSASRTRLSFDNHGIFAQGTYKFTDQLALTAGARYTFDKIVGVAEDTRYTFVPVPGLGVIPVSQVCNDALNHPGVDVLASGDRSQCRTRIVNKSNEPTWMINLDFKPTPDLMVYAKYSRGYRQGGINFTNPGLETWQPEKLDAYEIGVKSSFGGAVSGYVNLAAFYNDFTGQQIFGQLRARPNTGLASGAGIQNAGKSRIYGVEIDASATFFDSMKVDLGYTYLNTKLKSLIAPDLTGTPWAAYIASANVGDVLPLSPKHRLTLSGTYTLPLDQSVGELSLGATFTYTARQVAVISSPVGILPSTSLLNLNADWQDVAGLPVDLSFFVTNVTNKIYPVNAGGAFASYGFDQLLIGQPRMWGVRLRYKFGE